MIVTAIVLLNKYSIFILKKLLLTIVNLVLIFFFFFLQAGNIYVFEHIVPV